MDIVCAKVYYLINNGEVLTIKSEMQGTIEATTKEQDMVMCIQLKDRHIDEVDFIEIPYGTLNTTFNNAKSYSVNLETKRLEVIYYNQEELNAMNQQNIEVEDLNTRISDISSYLNNSNQDTITDIENSILEIEKNKIINGGI